MFRIVYPTFEGKGFIPTDKLEILNVEYLCMYLHVGVLTMMIYFLFFFNSPEPKVQVSFSVRSLSVVRRRRRRCR